MFRCQEKEQKNIPDIIRYTREAFTGEGYLSVGGALV